MKTMKEQAEAAAKKAVDGIYEPDRAIVINGTVAQLRYTLDEYLSQCVTEAFHAGVRACEKPDNEDHIRDTYCKHTCPDNVRINCKWHPCEELEEFVRVWKETR